MSSYLIAKKPTPLLNTPHFHAVFGSQRLPLDEKGLLRPVEMVAFPGTKFKVVSQMDAHIYQVTTQDYPHGPIYLDERFASKTDPLSRERQKILPPLETILSRLHSSVGLPYIWGGNWGKGIPEIGSYYQPRIPPDLLEIWTLAGVDCSGLLYEATSGFTPRNTSELVTFGEQVSSLENVKPLDILVWPGHVIILINRTTVIESLHGKGVILTPLRERLASLASTNFVIRRFL